MINDYNLEYTDIIQYLNQIVIKKSERLNIIFKAIDYADSRIKSNVNFDVTMEVLFLTIKERMKK